MNSLVYEYVPDRSIMTEEAEENRGKAGESSHNKQNAEEFEENYKAMRLFWLDKVHCL